MAQRKKYTPERIVSLLRQVEVAVASRRLNERSTRAVLHEDWPDCVWLIRHSLGWG